MNDNQDNQNGQLKNLRREWRRIFSGEDPERTIRIVPINQHDICDCVSLGNYIELEYVHNFFEKFGRVESTNNRSLIKNELYSFFDKLHYVLVQFEDGKVTVDLMKRGRIIIINDIQFKVQPLYKNVKPRGRKPLASFLYFK